MKRAHQILLLCLIALCGGVGASTSSAATIYGDDLTIDPYTQGAELMLVIARDSAGAEDPGIANAGVITKLRIRTSGAGGSVTAMVARPMRPYPGFLYDVTTVALESIIVTPDASPSGHITEKSVRVPVLAGDTLGIAGPTSIATSHPLSGSSAQTCGWRPLADVPPAGATSAFNNGSCNQWWPSIQAVVEPDVDADGYGDETQDLCASDATRQTTCPALPAHDITVSLVKQRSRLSASTTRSFKITNGGGTAATNVLVSVKSSKSVKSLKILSGCKVARSGRSCAIQSLAPGASKTIKVRVSRRSALRTKLTVRATAVGELATANNSAATTVKFKAKKK